MNLHPKKRHIRKMNLHPKKRRYLAKFMSALPTPRGVPVP